ncbi:MAG: glycosyltransferase [Parcubacteria group bacterium]|jgi:GT2 family glycosyltransferase
MKVSYIITTYNRFATLVYHIKSIMLQRYFCDDLQIIVADDGSQDMTTIIASIFKGITYVNTESRDRAWPAKARNLGIEAATNELVIFADDDCLPHPKLLREYQKINKGECLVGYRSSNRQSLAIEIDRLQPVEYLEPGNPRAYMVRQSQGIFGHMHYTTGTCAILKADLAGARFDEEFTGYGFEDRHFGWLLSQQGLIFRFFPTAIIYHDHDSFNRSRDLKNEELIKNKEMYVRKLSGS